MMGSFVLVRNGRHLSTKEEYEILDYLHQHETDDDAIPTLMEKYKCSRTNILNIMVAEALCKIRNEKEARKMKNRAVSAIIGVILMVAITVSIAATVYWYVSENYQSTDDESSGAIVAARDYVRGELKSPSTATFWGENARSIGNIWTVTGSGSSQNSFGGTVDFTYTVKMNDNGNSWSLISCDVQE